MSDVTVQDASGNTRVVLGNIGTAAAPDYGLKVVSSDGSTTIIDGTSDMFKISATGTLSVAVGTGAQVDTTVTLTGLGSVNNAPAIVGLPNVGGTLNLVGAGYHRTPTAAGAPRTNFVASTSGGSPTLGWVRPDFEGWMHSELSGAPPATPVVRLAGVSQFAGATTVQGRYYVLTEVAL